MKILIVRFKLILVLLSVFAAPEAGAALIIAGRTDLPSVATMNLTLLANTPFNPTTSNIVLTGVSGTGTLTFDRNAEDATRTITGAISGGMYYGSNAALGSYVFGNVPPLTGANFSASITNVVQDPNDPGYATGQPSSFRSGTFTLGGPSFGFEFLTGQAAGITLFTDPTVPFQFMGNLDGLPPSSKSILTNTGPDVLNVLYGGQVVAQSFDRTIQFLPSSVPEPASLLMVGTGALGVVATMRRLKAH